SSTDTSAARPPPSGKFARRSSARTRTAPSSLSSGRRDVLLDARSSTSLSTRAMNAPKQREIAVSEFFSKNRHLLGFDSPQKALLTAVREAVDNALDACEEARIPPSVTVELSEQKDGRYTVRVEDNGPGIPKEEIGKIFAKLLYGSKFHRLKQSRGQQGIGISAAVMYGQMTTGEPASIISKMAGGKAQHVRLFIDTAKNQPKIDLQKV